MKKIIRVKDVMSADVMLVEGLATVQDGIDLLLAKEGNTLFVNRRNEDDEYGIVVLADIAQKVLAKGKATERINLYEIMTKPVMGVSPDMNIRYCARMFAMFGLSAAPVMVGREIIGVVTYQDIVLHGLAY